ncbi:MAG: hypothetical protein MI861_22465, partial [Pirellulales bacterium]|nr:hypothetical protein [Pirellulales bacterium]
DRLKVGMADPLIVIRSFPHLRNHIFHQCVLVSLAATMTGTSHLDRHRAGDHFIEKNQATKSSPGIPSLAIDVYARSPTMVSERGKFS